MQFKLDENLPLSVQALLLERGHDAHTVAQEGLTGAEDAAVITAAVNEVRIRVTLDVDFADMRAYPPTRHTGVWVLRPERQSIQAIESVIENALKLAENEPTAGRLWVIDEQRVRIRDNP